MSFISEYSQHNKSASINISRNFFYSEISFPSNVDGSFFISKQQKALTEIDLEDDEDSVEIKTEDFPKNIEQSIRLSYNSNSKALLHDISDFSLE